MVSAQWRRRPLQMFPMSQKGEVFSGSICSVLNPSSTPSSSTLTYIRPPPTPRSTLHPPSYTHHPVRQWQSGVEAYKRVKDFGGRAEETSVDSRSCDQLPPTALHILHHSPLDLWAAPTLPLSLLLKHTHSSLWSVTCTPVTACSSWWC